jgi:hypothetical protein
MTGYAKRHRVHCIYGFTEAECGPVLQVLRVSHSVALHNKTEIAGNRLGYGDMREEVLNGNP